MKRRVRASRRVWAQLDRTSRWWRTNRDKAPDAFDTDVADAFETIRANPDIGTAVRSRRRGVRALWLPRIRYFVYYRAVDEKTVEVLSIWHASRRAPHL